MPAAPPYYSVLKQTRHIRDISDLDGAVAAMPATIHIHAVHVADGEIPCGYTPKDGDVPEPDVDWGDVRDRDVACDDSGKKTQGNQ